jgi:hypothetical protein
VDVLAKLQIQPSTFLSSEAKEVEEPKDQHVIVPTDLAEAAEIEARSEHARIYFSSTCPLGECLKQTSEEAAAKRYWDHHERTREFLMNGPIPKKRVVGLMDVIDEDEELCYIDDGTPMEISERSPSTLKPVEDRINPMRDVGQGLGQKSSDHIELGSSEIEKHMENQSRSPPPTFEEAEKPVEQTTGGDTILDSKDDDTLLLENVGTFL